jgi:hypothetical protein
MPKAIEIGTSIAPGTRVDIQKAAIESWRNCGFHVVSFNEPDEIDSLEASFPGVRFVPQPRNGNALVGKPLIFISDILRHLASPGAGIGGIINSDIILSPEGGLGEFLREQAVNSFVYGPRLDVHSADESNGTMDLFGFDYFIFDQVLDLGWEETSFCLGMPFWDHWLPLIAILGGHVVKKVASPVARHVVHPVAWDGDTLAFNDQFIRTLIDRQTRLSASGDEAARSVSIEFKSLQIERPYFRLRAKIQELTDASAPQSEIMESLEELARHFDSVTREILRFLDRHSRKITFEPGGR